MQTLKIKSWKKNASHVFLINFYVELCAGSGDKAGMLFAKNKGKGKRQPLMFNRWFLSSKTLFLPPSFKLCKSSRKNQDFKP